MRIVDKTVKSGRISIFSDLSATDKLLIDKLDKFCLTFTRRNSDTVMNEAVTKKETKNKTVTKKETERQR